MMISLKISKKLKQACPDIRLGVIQSDIQYQKENQYFFYLPIFP